MSSRNQIKRGGKKGKYVRNPNTKSSKEGQYPFLANNKQGTTDHLPPFLAEVWGPPRRALRLLRLQQAPCPSVGPQPLQQAPRPSVGPQPLQQAPRPSAGPQPLQQAPCPSARPQSLPEVSWICGLRVVADRIATTNRLGAGPFSAPLHF